MIVIVTGGIGSGKSQVCRMLEEMYGFPVYEADRKAKELYVRYPELLSSIEKELDCRIRNEEGAFQPSLLAGRIFGDEKAIAVVESLLFPYLISDFKEFAESSGNIIIFESATVLAKPQFDGFADKVVLVDAPYELRISRACERDGISKESVMARMSAQPFPPFAEVDEAKIYEIILNDGSLDELKAAVKGLAERLSGADIK